jgi:hypothetical protein
MSWPRSTDYFEAVQNLRSCMSDEELLDGQVALNDQGLPLLWSGGFADVYRIECPATGNTWALKCFTREVAGQRERYREISAHLDHVRLPFTVDFQYLESGIRINGHWFPALKMRWVEGLGLNQFVESHLDRPKMLDQLLALWPKLAGRLRAARMAHADLQHGNVLLVPSGKNLALRLIDYDGMYVPSLAGRPSGELGHPAYQHPQRLREGTYSAEVDRFSHLAIYCAVRCLRVGQRQLWQQFNNGDNLLFRESDFRSPAESSLFRALWELPDPGARALTGRLALACNAHLDNVPLLGDVLAKGKVMPLDPREESAVKSLLTPASKPRGAAIGEDDVPLEWLATPAEQEAIQQGLADKRLPPPLDVGQKPLLARVVSKVVQLIGGWGPEPEQPPLAAEPVSSEETPHARCSERPASTPWHRRLLWWLTAPLRVVDRLLLAMVGQDNTILHNFIRCVAIVVFAVAAGFAGWQLYERGWARPARELAAARLLQQEANRKAAEENKKAEEAARKKAEQDGAMKKLQEEADRKKAEKEAAQRKAEHLAAQEKAQAEAARKAAEQKKAEQERAVLRETDEKAKVLRDAREFGTQIRVFKGHNLSGFAVAFSPDGKQILTTSTDRTAILWDIDTAQPVRVFSGHSLPVLSVAFSADGKRVLTGSADESAIVWNADTAQRIHVFKQAESPMYSVAFSPDANCVLTASGGNAATLWSLDSKQTPRKFGLPGLQLFSATISPGGGRVLTGSWDNTAILWSVDTTRQIHVFKGHKLLVSSVAFSPDGKRVLTGSADNTAILWDANTGQQIRVFKGHNKAVLAVAFSPDGKRVLTGSQDKTAMLWDADTGRQIHVFAGHTDWVRSVAFSPDGSRVLTGSPDNTAILWGAGTTRLAVMAAIPGPPVARDIVFDLGSNVKLELVPIPAGYFRNAMTKPFFLGKYEVTQEQWNALMDDTLNNIERSTTPVHGVKLSDCHAFLRSLNDKCATRGMKFRLPTPIEWEYACLAGGRGPFCYGSDETRLADYAWFVDNAGGKAHPVGKKRPNIWGLFDMHGNVCEWCDDPFSPDADVIMPAARGGSWIHSAANCAASRLEDPRLDTVGLRVAYGPANQLPNTPTPTRTADDANARASNTSAENAESHDDTAPDSGTYYAVAVVDVNGNRVLWSKVIHATRREASKQLRDKYWELAQDIITACDTLAQRKRELSSLDLEYHQYQRATRGAPGNDTEQRDTRAEWMKQSQALRTDIRRLERKRDTKLSNKLVALESREAAEKRISQWKSMEHRKSNGKGPSKRGAVRSDSQPQPLPAMRPPHS